VEKVNAKKIGLMSIRALAKVVLPDSYFEA